MKALLILMIMWPFIIGATEFNAKSLKCESINSNEMYLKCDNEKFYKLEQKSFNEPLVTSDLQVNDSKEIKRIENTPPTSPDNTKNTSTISK